jgi:hypothetical protein
LESAHCRSKSTEGWIRHEVLVGIIISVTTVVGVVRQVVSLVHAAHGTHLAHGVHRSHWHSVHGAHAHHANLGHALTLSAESLLGEKIHQGVTTGTGIHATTATRSHCHQGLLLQQGVGVDSTSSAIATLVSIAAVTLLKSRQSVGVHSRHAHSLSVLSHIHCWYSFQVVILSNRR